MTSYDFIDRELQRLKDEGLFINIRTIESPQGAWIVVDGKKVLNMCANNYLGFANNPRLRRGAKRAIDNFGVGPAAVRTIAGTMSLHNELEQRLTEFKKVGSVISLQSGLCANIATIPALMGEGDVIFSDELNHASIIDGCRLSKAKVIRYAHADSDSLEENLKKEPVMGKRMIITDGVFSMDGNIAPLPAIVELAERYGAIVMVDDAHGEGVLGDHGRGIVDHFNLHGKVDIEIGTLSKAFGVVGGYVAGKKSLIDFLRQKGRPFLFSSATTPPDVAACIEAVNILEGSEKEIKRLWRNTRYFQKKIKKMGFDIGKTQTPITPVIIGDERTASDLSKRLFEEGIFAQAIGYPTVPKGKARIRVMLSATHNRKDLDFALEVFQRIGRETKILA